MGKRRRLVGMWFTFHEKIAFREGDWITHEKHDKEYQRSEIRHLDYPIIPRLTLLMQYSKVN